MDFVFTGFKQIKNLRQFAFEGIAEDRSRTTFFVDADLMLIRKYQITVQELPLLCIRLLGAHSEGSHAITFTEEDMRSYATNRTAAKDLAASKRKPARRPASPAIGSAWRGPANVV